MVGHPEHGQDFTDGDKVVVFVGGEEEWAEGVYKGVAYRHGERCFHVRLNDRTDYYGVNHPERDFWVPTLYRIHKGRLK